MNPRIVTEYIGSTLRSTLVCSGATITPLYSALYGPAETLVNSAAGVSSGDGHYYADLALPNSAQWMVNKWVGVIGVNTYVRMGLVRVKTLETD